MALRLDIARLDVARLNIAQLANGPLEIAQLAIARLAMAQLAMAQPDVATTNWRCYRAKRMPDLAAVCDTAAEGLRRQAVAPRTQTAWQVR